MNATIPCYETASIRPSALPSLTSRMVPIGGVAILLGVSERHAKKMHAAGELPSPHRFGRSVRFDLLELNEWLTRVKPDGTRPTRKEWAWIRASVRGR